MAQRPTLNAEAATELHNRLAKEIIAKIAKEPIAAGGTISDALFLCESVLVGVLIEFSRLGNDTQLLDLIVTRVKDRLADVRLTNVTPRGHG